MQSVVITGASTGIGLAAAQILTARGMRVFGSVRKQADAVRLQAELGTGFVPLIFDVTDEEKVRAAAEQVRAALNGETLFGLVNNAGIAQPGPLMHQPVSEFRHQIEVNLVGQLIVTQAFLPLLGAGPAPRGTPGRVINISSSSGREGSPFLGGYSASKFALEGFSESLRRELNIYGIDVIIVAPGPIQTPIWDKAEQLDLSPYENTDYAAPARAMMAYAVKSGRKGLPAQTVAQVILKALTSAHPRVRYDVRPGNPLVNLIGDLLPSRWVDVIITRAMGLTPKR
jgi:NAD(P)-dependent dehydrogenase (short-subunit alcohol dehydrogenase family)